MTTDNGNDANTPSESDKPTETTLNEWRIRAETAEKEFAKAKGATLRQLDWAGFQCGEEYQDLIERIKKTERERNDAREEIKRVRHLALNAERDLAETTGRLDDAMKRVATAEKDRTEAESFAAETRKKAETLSTQLDAAHKALDKANAKLDKASGEWLDNTLKNPDEQTKQMFEMDEARILANIQRNMAQREAEKWKSRAEKAATVIDGLKLALANRTSRAEAAEARTAPAVTKADIEECVYGSRRAGRQCDEQGFVPVHIQEAVGQLWDLHKGDDPAVHVVRESDITAVRVERRENGDWYATPGGFTAGREHDAAHCRKQAGHYLNRFGEFEAVARAIEAEQAADPVEELAGQIESATREAIRQVCVDLADVAPSLDPMAVERAMEVTAASRKIAAHVLGQEAGDE